MSDPVRVVTLAGEFGSGRREIGRRVAERLNWQLLDKEFIQQVAHMSRTDPETVRQFDECIDSWLHRIHKTMWRGGFEGIATSTAIDVFDADKMADLAQRIIGSAAAQGKYVIVGRGGQCILQRRKDCFHVFVYGPFDERVERVRKQTQAGTDVPAMVRYTDRMRAAYIRRNFGQEWTNPHLYDLMLSTSLGPESAAETIVAAVISYGD